MIHFYRLVTSLMYFAIYPWAWMKASNGEVIWRNRIGLDLPDDREIWLHAASVGEVRVMSYLANHLLSHDNSLRLHLTCMTRAGMVAAGSLFGDSVTRSYFPFDAPKPVKRALDQLSTKMIVIAETEIWPLLISEASARNVEIVQVNGKMSEKSFSRYKIVRGMMRGLLKKYQRLFVRTSVDAGRFAALGAQSESVEITGDMKFDAPLVERSTGRISELRHRFGFEEKEFVWVAGSTRPGEEDQLLGSYIELRKKHSSLRLALAPRHLDRIKEVSPLLKSLSVPYRLFGKDGLSPAMGEMDNEPPVILVNRLGVLVDFYLVADVAFVGGTLAPIGGHNLLEPVWAGTPVLVGPHLQNVMEGVEYISDGNFGRKCEDIQEISKIIDRMITGEITFARKNETSLSHSATAKVGTYILDRLQNA